MLWHGENGKTVEAAIGLCWFGDRQDMDFQGNGSCD